MNKLHEAFKNTRQLKPSKDLEMAILSQVKAQKAKLMRDKLILSYTSLIGSTVATFYTFFIFGQSILKSDFWNLLMLMFSDAEIVIRNWNDYLFSLLENFPSVSLVAILLPIFLLMISINHYLNLNYKRHKFI